MARRGIRRLMQAYGTGCAPPSLVTAVLVVGWLIVGRMCVSVECACVRACCRPIGHSIFFLAREASVYSRSHVAHGGLQRCGAACFARRHGSRGFPDPSAQRRRRGPVNRAHFSQRTREMQVMNHSPVHDALREHGRRNYCGVSFFLGTTVKAV